MSKTLEFDLYIDENIHPLLFADLQSFPTIEARQQRVLTLLQEGARIESLLLARMRDGDASVKHPLSQGNPSDSSLSR